MQFAEIRKTIDLPLMTRYSGDGNFHSDEEAAKKVGLSGAIVQGGQLAGYLSEMMIATFGKRYLESGEIAVSFIKTVKAGETVVTKGEVTETEAGRMHCDVWLENQQGEKVTVGKASVGA